MREWKQAFSIAKLELKASLLSFLFALAFVLFITAIIASTLDSYLDNGYAGFDLLFILIFTFAPVWTKRKEFQIQMIRNLLVSPIVVMQNQLSITKEVLVKSRFIIHFFYSFPYQLIAVIVLYAYSPLQHMLSFGEFIAFAVIWIAFGVYVGYSIPYSDVGQKSKFHSDTLMSVVGFILLIGVLMFLSFAHLLFGNGIVYWSIALVQKWPIFSSIFSILLAIAGFYHWKFYMKKQMSTIDYL